MSKQKETLMPDLSALLSRPSGEAKKPPPMPPGNYKGIVRSYENVISNKKKTPGIQFNIGPLEWPDDVDQGETEGIDLSKKVLRHTVWVSEDSLWALDEFMRDTLKMEMGRQYLEMLPETIGQELMVLVVQRQNDKGEPIHLIDRVGPVE